MRANLRSLVRDLPTARSWKPSTWLLAVGLGFWLIAQALPAAVSHSLGEDPFVFLGFDLTVFGFVPAALSLISGSPAVGVLGLSGWFGNVFLAAVLVLRGRGVHPRRATTWSIAGLVCAVAGVVALHLSPDITSVEAGTWVWLSSMAVMPLAMVSWWLVEWGGETRPGTQHVTTRQAGQVPAVDALDPTGLVSGIRVAVVVGFFVVARGILAVGGLIGLGVLVIVALAIVGWVVWPRDDEGNPTPPAIDSGLPHGHH